MQEQYKKGREEETIEGENRANPVKLEAINKEGFVRAID